MEVPETHRTVKKPPPVPIQTYKWEDVRRARRKGGYPWTYLYKGPLDESVVIWSPHGVTNGRKALSVGNIRAMEAGSSTNVSISQYLDPDDVPGTSTAPEPKRAKSEEPRKRKHSMESSYSRVSKYSLYKKGILKRLRDCKQKFMGSFSALRRPLSKSQPVSTAQSKTELVQAEKKLKVEAKAPPTGPLYIHIPLKPPPGQTDEFSYLEFESSEKKERVAKKEESKDSEESSVPETPLEEKAGVQLIFLTAPSDDEILDTPETPSMPQSPSEENGNDLVELKTIAKSAADKYSPESKRKYEAAQQANAIEESKEANEDKTKLKQEEGQLIEKREEEITEAVTKTEETNANEESIKSEETNKKKKKSKKSKKESQKTDDDKLEEQMREEQVKTTTSVDEEDGLKTESVVADIIEQEIKDREKREEVITPIEDPASPVLLKKKVSFKRRSKEDADGIYEDVQVTTVEVSKKSEEEPSEEANKPIDNPMLDIVKTLKHEKYTKGMSLAEEYAYWCKINSGQDYEPINVPSEIVYSSEDSAPQKPKASTPVTDSDIEFLAAKAADIELRTTGVMTVSKEPSDKAMLVSLESALKLEPEPEPKEEKEKSKIQEVITKQASNLKRQASILSKKAGDQADKLQTRVKSIKRPKIKMPPKPKFEKPNLPKLKMDKIKPKMEQKVKHLSASLKLPKKQKVRRTSLDESSIRDKSPKRTVFDFTTYPRMFKRKKRDKVIVIDDVETTTSSKSAITMPKLGLGRGFKDKITTVTTTTTKSISTPKSSDQGSIRIPLHSEGSMDRDSLDLRSKEERELEAQADQNEELYLKETQEIHRASSLNDRWNHGTFFRQPEPMVTDLDEPYEKPLEKGHSGSTDDIRQRGVLEEINSDEFFLRQKGISQDNIEVGAYLSSEIREAFKAPQGLPPEAPRRKPLKKPKRKKTPHVSQEGLQADRESIHTEPEEYPKYYNIENAEPERPQRRRKKSLKDLSSLEDQIFTQPEDFNILTENFKKIDDYEPPNAPPRKHKSLRSLNYSEKDSIMGEFDENFKEIQHEVDRLQDEYQIPTPEVPKRPSRTRSRSRGPTTPEPSTENQEICEEEPCQKVLCDYMGYSVIDKSQIRDPPLPPLCRRQSDTTDDRQQFATTPRSMKYQEEPEQPVRPLRNYSTLGPSRPPRKSSMPNMTDEEKGVSEGVMSYHEYELQNAVDLQSGEVIQKMKDRPLPAPPRPPRKTRDTKSQEKGALEVETPKEEEETQKEPEKRTTTTEFQHEETVTHGTLLVQPYKHDDVIPEGPIETFSRSTERIVTVRKERGEGETTEIPLEFHDLKSPSNVIERIIEKHIPVQMEGPTSVELLKASKLQVGDLDVDHLAVNELIASKIKVSEIEGTTVNVGEINSQSGSLVVGGIELPPSFFQQLVEKLQEQNEQKPSQSTPAPPTIPPLPQSIPELQAESMSQQELLTLSEEELLRRLKAEITSEEEEVGQKKTPFEVRRVIDTESPRLDSRQESPPPRPPQPQVLIVDQLWTDSDYGRAPAAQIFEVQEHPIPSAHRRRRHRHHHHHKTKASEHSSDESSSEEVVRRHRQKTKSPEPTIPQLSGQLTRACINSIDGSVRRVLQKATDYVMGCNLDKRQDLNVAVAILLVFIACVILFLWGNGGNGKHVHHHHWEYFNPPRDI